MRLFKYKIKLSGVTYVYIRTPLPDKPVAEPEPVSKASDKKKAKEEKRKQKKSKKSGILPGNDIDMFPEDDGQ